MMKTIDVFAAYETNDSGGRKLLGHFIKHHDDIVAAAHMGAWGSNGDVESIKLKIYETFDEYKAERLAKARNRALDKLSEEEKEALGLLYEVVHILSDVRTGDGNG